MSTPQANYPGPDRRVADQPYAGTEKRSATPPSAGNFENSAERNSEGNWTGNFERTSRSKTAHGTESKAKFLGHPLHQQLVVFPLGLLATGVIFDVIYLINGSPTMAVVAFWMMVAGLIGGALATPFGLWDWLEIPENTRAKSIGVVHGMGNIAVMALFLISVLGRINDEATPPVFALVLSFASGALAGDRRVGRCGAECIELAAPALTACRR